jgi:plastocyanin domain-containing protein
MNIVLVNLAGIAVIVIIVWWFWMSQPTAQRARTDVIDILVEGGTYTPPRIEVEAGKQVTLRFLRKDASPCAEKVVFDKLGINADLAMGESTDIVVTPPEPGEYIFTCQMQMYRGSLVARREAGTPS